MLKSARGGAGEAVGDGGDEATTERTTTMESGEEDGDVTRWGGDEVEVALGDGGAVAAR